LPVSFFERYRSVVDQPDEVIGPVEDRIPKSVNWPTDVVDGNPPDNASEQQFPSHGGTARIGFYIEAIREFVAPYEVCDEAGQLALSPWIAKRGITTRASSH